MRETGRMQSEIDKIINFDDIVKATNEFYIEPRNSRVAVIRRCCRGVREGPIPYVLGKIGRRRWNESESDELQPGHCTMKACYPLYEMPDFKSTRYLKGCQHNTNSSEKKKSLKK